MIKIVHIINSKIFIGRIIDRFSDELFENIFILLNLEDKPILMAENILVITPNSAGKKEILKIMNNADVAVHYFLDYTKSELILKANSSVKHYWVFFGGDIYNQLSDFREDLYFKKTKRWLRYKFLFRFRPEFRYFKYKILQRKKSPKEILIESFSKIEKVLGSIDDEIDLVNEKVKLPEYLRFNFFDIMKEVPSTLGKLNINSNKILIGNSSAIENNHLDVLEVLKKIDIQNLFFSIPLSYGKPKSYSFFVKKQFKKHLNSHVYFLDKSMELASYYEWLNEHPTVIMLHKRQQALGNLKYLIANGSKVYLSEKNVLYNWFLKNKVLVFSFEKLFIQDCKNNNLVLLSNEREHNYSAIIQLFKSESYFFDELKSN